MKYKNHRTIPAVQAKYKDKNKFFFTEGTTQDIEKEVFSLRN